MPAFKASKAGLHRFIRRNLRVTAAHNRWRTEGARLEVLHGRRVHEVRRHVLRLLQPLLVELLELARRRGACWKSASCSKGDAGVCIQQYQV